MRHLTLVKRRLKFAIEFAAIGQQEIEGWLSYFEDMDVNELGAARARRLEVWRRLHFLVMISRGRGSFLCRV